VSYLVDRYKFQVPFGSRLAGANQSFTTDLKFQRGIGELVGQSLSTCSAYTYHKVAIGEERLRFHH
jgi:hypothetical protein